ncbi:phage protein NinX family protein [Paraburkholderia youngii]|uniref:phage protein NinX family protein n=1 Tax=Paraburkholderia youngii TaxID=2782701 RepID=UPI003D229F19
MNLQQTEQATTQGALMLAVETLRAGDQVDLSSCPFLKAHPAADLQYGVVEEVERETPECVAVWYESFNSVGYPLGTMLKVSPETFAKHSVAHLSEVSRQLASLVLEQAVSRGLEVEADAVRDAVDQFCKLHDIAATETERVAACDEAQQLWLVHKATTEADPDAQPSWDYVVEHFGLDASFDYSAADRAQYYQLLKVEQEGKGNGADLPESEDAATRDDVPSKKLKSQLIASWLGAKGVALDGHRYLAAHQEKAKRVIVVVDGRFDRSVFKAAHEEARSAGVEAEKMHVYCQIATYTGRSIEITKFEDVQVKDLDRKQRKRVRVADLSGLALDWAVALARGCTMEDKHDAFRRIAKDVWSEEKLAEQLSTMTNEPVIVRELSANFEPIPAFSTSREHGGLIVEEEGIATRRHTKSGLWFAMMSADLGDREQPAWSKWTTQGGTRYGNLSYQVNKRQQLFSGETQLIAAMRCYVASKLGEEVEVPVVLLAA